MCLESLTSRKWRRNLSGSSAFSVNISGRARQSAHNKAEPETAVQAVQQQRDGRPADLKFASDGCRPSDLTKTPFSRLASVLRECGHETMSSVCGSCFLRPGGCADPYGCQGRGRRRRGQKLVGQVESGGGAHKMMIRFKMSRGQLGNRQLNLGRRRRHVRLRSILASVALKSGATLD